MTNNKNFLLSALAFVMAGCVCVPSVKAADDVVLYKIHDVKPIKNEAGALVGCDYNATFYNRSSYSLKSADLNFVWFDDTVDGLAKQEQQNKEQQAANRSSRNKRTTAVKTPESSLASVSSSLQLANLGPQQQKTVHTKISSDRCFLLIGEVSLSASNCDVSSADGSSSSFKGGQGCNGLFQFVSPSDPQYYSEFKQVSPEEEKLQQENARIEQRNKINQAYGETLAQFKKVTEALNGIKGNVDPNAVDVAPVDEVQASVTEVEVSAPVVAEDAAVAAPTAPASSPAPAENKPDEAQLQDKLDQLFPESAAQPENLVPQQTN